MNILSHVVFRFVDWVRDSAFSKWSKKYDMKLIPSICGRTIRALVMKYYKMINETYYFFDIYSMWIYKI